MQNYANRQTISQNFTHRQRNKIKNTHQDKINSYMHASKTLVFLISLIIHFASIDNLSPILYLQPPESNENSLHSIFVKK